MNIRNLVAVGGLMVVASAAVVTTLVRRHRQQAAMQQVGDVVAEATTEAVQTIREQGETLKEELNNAFNIFNEGVAESRATMTAQAQPEVEAQAEARLEEVVQVEEEVAPTAVVVENQDEVVVLIESRNGGRVWNDGPIMVEQVLTILIGEDFIDNTPRIIDTDSVVIGEFGIDAHLLTVPMVGWTIAKIDFTVNDITTDQTWYVTEVEGKLSLVSHSVYANGSTFTRSHELTDVQQEVIENAVAALAPAV